MSLSQNIKQLRLEKELTQEQLAAMLGVSPQAVSKWETSETYPDGSLLVPLANALEVSLDVLFDNKWHSMKDLSARIQTIIQKTPKKDQFHLVRDICWQIEKGLFSTYMNIDGQYHQNEIASIRKSSYILNDYGFTYISNGSAPFFSVFPEYGNSFADVIQDGEKIRNVFSAFSTPEAMRVLLFLYNHEYEYTFEAEVLAKCCDISLENAIEVLNDFIQFGLVEVEPDIEIDGKKRILWRAQPNHVVIALMLFANELMYDDGYTLQAHHRNKPYL